jgi:hypothetical protein
MMRSYDRFSIFILICSLSLSCSPSKKEIRSEHTGKQAISSSTGLEKDKSKDTASSTALQKSSSTIADTLAGMIYVSGNEPFTHLMISVAGDMQYRVEADSTLRSSLWQLQGKKISLIGIKKSSPMGTSVKVLSFSQSP